MTPHDVVVIGAGPGGCAAALTAARRGLSVLLADPSDGREPKPCGEGLMPAARAALAALGLEGALAEGRPFHALRYCVVGREPLELALPSPGLALPRARLQAALDAAVAAQAGIERARCTARATRDGDGAFDVELAGGRRRARALVAADGLGGKAAPWLRSARGPRAAGRIGVRAHYLARRPFDAVEVHFAGRLEVYVTPLADDRVNVAVLADVPRRGASGHTAQGWMDEALAALPDLRAALGAQVEPPRSRRLGGRAPGRMAGGGAFLVGDAGGGVDPVLGCGTTIALRTGCAAGEAVAALLATTSARQVERAYDAFYRSETRARRALASGLQRLAHRPPLARGVLDLARRFPGLTRRLTFLAAGAVQEPRLGFDH